MANPTRSYTTFDKSSWSHGPWENEPDKVQWVDKATGLDCLIVRNRMGALCGYVGVSIDHPLYAKDYEVADVDVHGGLTFADGCDEDADEDKGICHVPTERSYVCPACEPDRASHCLHGGDNRRRGVDQSGRDHDAEDALGASSEQPVAGASGGVNESSFDPMASTDMAGRVIVDDDLSAETTEPSDGLRVAGPGQRSGDGSESSPALSGHQAAAGAAGDQGSDTEGVVQEAGRRNDEGPVADARPDVGSERKHRATPCPKCGGPRYVEPTFWFGFDCAHGGDLLPAMDLKARTNFGRTFSGTYRTVGYVRAECASLAKQLAELA